MSHMHTVFSLSCSWFIPCVSSPGASHYIALYGGKGGFEVPRPSILNFKHVYDVIHIVHFFIHSKHADTMTQSQYLSCSPSAFVSASVEHNPSLIFFLFFGVLGCWSSVVSIFCSFYFGS